VDGGSWGLIQDLGGGTTGGVNPKYYVLAQYACHIRPGMRIIDGGNANTIAAYAPTTRKLIIVATNYSTAHQDTTMHGTRFWSYFEPNTIQTFEVPDITL
jgi:galactan endo-1,6-beta-galactosidase